MVGSRLRSNKKYSSTEPQASGEVPRIIYEDPYVMVLDKPPGIVVDKSETQTENTLEDWLGGEYSNLPERGGIVHRLDKDTSGLILVAKTEDALLNLQIQFKDRIVSKEYTTLVHGYITESGKVEGAVGRNPGDREKFTVLEDGKEALTEYYPIEKFEIRNSKFEIIFNDFNKIQLRKLERMKYNEFALLKCKPLTGRTHQIRVHLKYIGHPVVSDEKYAGRKVYRLDHRWCPRQFLHASKIRFKHPVTGEWLEFKCELPEDLRIVLDSLRSLEQ